MKSRILPFLAALCVLSACKKKVGPEAKTPGSAAHALQRFWSFVPDDPNYLFVIRLDLLRGKEYSREFEEKLRDALPGFRLKADEIDEMLIAKDFDDYNITLLVRTARGMTLKDLFLPYEDDRYSKVDEFEAVHAASGFFPGVDIARIDERTYYFSRAGRERFERIVRAAKIGRAPRIGDEFRRVLDRVSENDMFLVVAPYNWRGRNDILNVMRGNGLLVKGGGVTFADSIRYVGTMGMEGAEAAEKAMEGWRTKADDPAFRAVTPTRDGTWVQLRGSWSEYAPFRSALVGDGLPVIGRPCF